LSGSYLSALRLDRAGEALGLGPRSVDLRLERADVGGAGLGGEPECAAADRRAGERDQSQPTSAAARARASGARNSGV
jgi:hypothetical protein